jgi:hypothetical protein
MEDVSLLGAARNLPCGTELEVIAENRGFEPWRRTVQQRRADAWVKTLSIRTLDKLHLLQNSVRNSDEKDPASSRSLLCTCQAVKLALSDWPIS